MTYVYERIAAIADARPDSPAIVCRKITTTYGQLWEQARAYGAAIAAAEVPAGSVVGIATDRSTGFVAGLLGAWLAGCAFVPVDMQLPELRRLEMLDRVGASLLITPGARFDVGIQPDSRRIAQIDLEAPAYVLFTSGSTGRPKGVAVSHRALANTVDAFARRPRLAAAPNNIAIGPLTFDISIFEIFVTLGAGATLVLADADERLAINRTAALIRRHRVGWVIATPTWLRLALAVRPDCVAGLLVISGGEALDRDLAEQLLDRDATLWNAYGPTETAIVATCHEVTRLDPGPVPIGVPIEGTTAFVLDQYGVDCPIDTPGELWIGGAGVGIGYLGEPELTAAAFVTDPVRGRLYRTGDFVYRDAAGRLHFVGRADDQVKIRGHRIELGEIEHVARQHRAVRHAAALAVERAGWGRVIELAVETLHEPDTITDELDGLMAARLPDYMRPHRTVVVHPWPVNAHGKTDRRALRAVLDDLAAPAGRTVDSP